MFTTSKKVTTVTFIKIVARITKKYVKNLETVILLDPALASLAGRVFRFCLSILTDRCRCRNLFSQSEASAESAIFLVKSSEFPHLAFFKIPYS